jgi:hypothetical protein
VIQFAILGCCGGILIRVGHNRSRITGIGCRSKRPIIGVDDDVLKGIGIIIEMIPRRC